MNVTDIEGDSNFKFQVFLIWIYRNFHICLLSSMPFLSLGDSVLHFAVRASNREGIAELLIEKGAVVNVVNKLEAIPLEVAIDKGDEMKVKIWFFGKLLLNESYFLFDKFIRK